MKKEVKKITELTDRELSEIKTTHLLEINKSLKSISSNVTFIFWCFFLSIVATVVYLMS